MSDRKQQSLLKKRLKIDLEKDRVRKQQSRQKTRELGGGQLAEDAEGKGPGGQLAGEHAGEGDVGCQQEGHQAECEHEAE